MSSANRRNAVLVTMVGIAGVIGLAPRQAVAVAYTVVDLTPTGWLGGQAFGVTGGQQVGVGYGGTSQGTSAILWTDTSGGYVLLGSPAGFENSHALGVGDGQQVGYAQLLSPPPYVSGHAMLWSGSTDSVVDLNPADFDWSRAQAVAGGQQVGYGSSLAMYGNVHALLWTGSAASRVDLNPQGFQESWAYGVAGGQQVGYGYATGGGAHALLWNGSPDNYVDLNPEGLTCSAYGVADGQEVGFASGPATGSKQHACLWSGSASSFVDLNPDGFQISAAYGVAGGRQVGYGITNAGAVDALLWSGTSGSFVDLQSFLGPQYTSSRAFGVDGAGNIVGYAYVGPDTPHAIMWIPVPEPTALFLVALGGLMAARRGLLTGPSAVASPKVS